MQTYCWDQWINHKLFWNLISRNSIVHDILTLKHFFGAYIVSFLCKRFSTKHTRAHVRWQSRFIFAQASPCLSLHLHADTRTLAWARLSACAVKPRPTPLRKLVWTPATHVRLSCMIIKLLLTFSSPWPVWPFQLTNPSVSPNHGWYFCQKSLHVC